MGFGVQGETPGLGSARESHQRGNPPFRPSSPSQEAGIEGKAPDVVILAQAEGILFPSLLQRADSLLWGD